jgi:hypothetical protein
MTMIGRWIRRQSRFQIPVNLRHFRDEELERLLRPQKKEEEEEFENEATRTRSHYKFGLSSMSLQPVSPVAEKLTVFH